MEGSCKVVLAFAFLGWASMPFSMFGSICYADPLHGESSQGAGELIVLLENSIIKDVQLGQTASSAISQLMRPVVVDVAHMFRGMAGSMP